MALTAGHAHELGEISKSDPVCCTQTADKFGVKIPPQILLEASEVIKKVTNKHLHFLLVESVLPSDVFLSDLCKLSKLGVFMD